MRFLLLIFFSSPSLAEGEVSSVNFLESLLSANFVVQITFVILLMMSVTSWALISHKWVLFKKIQKENKKLSDVFVKATSFEEICHIARSSEKAPLSQIFSEGYNEMQNVLKENKSGKPSYYLDNIERSLHKSTQNQVAFLENGLGFLATAGNSCPFIGLFGTVFGIMDSFSEIAAMGSASLNVVAPGISEALIATGLGLFAAIPASIFYNTFINKIKILELEFNNFSTDFLNIAKRNFFKE